MRADYELAGISRLSQNTKKNKIGNFNDECVQFNKVMSPNKAKTVNLVSLRMRGHAQSSGYDRLTEYVPAKVIESTRNLSKLQRLTARFLRTFYENSSTQWYNRTNFIQELSIAKKWIFNGDQIFHFLYGENSYRYLGAFKALRRSNRIVCTYHTPPWRFKELIVDEGHLQLLDAVVVVSTSQRDQFAKIIGPDRVFFVPHGVDIEFFTTDKQRDNSDPFLRCIFVGNHLRDFGVLSDAAKLAEQQKLDIRFVVVARPEKRAYFEELKNVDFHSGLTDIELRSFYQDSDVLVLPLLDCTANNALLEGMACGLPVVSTDLQGVRDYTSQDCRILTPRGDSHALVDALKSIQEDAALRTRMSTASREYVKHFSWEEVAQQMQLVYKSLN